MIHDVHDVSHHRPYTCIILDIYGVFPVMVHHDSITTRYSEYRGLRENRFFIVFDGFRRFFGGVVPLYVAA